MVGETTARKNPQSIRELEEEFHRRLLEAKQKKVDLGKQMLELEKMYSAAEAEEDTWDSALYSLQNVGVSSGPKSRRRNGKSNEEEEGED